MKYYSNKSVFLAYWKVNMPEWGWTWHPSKTLLSRSKSTPLTYPKKSTFWYSLQSL